MMMRLAASDGVRLAIVCEQRGTLARNLEVGGEQEARKGGKKKTREEGGKNREKKQKTKRKKKNHVCCVVQLCSVWTLLSPIMKNPNL